jgi:DNA-binding MarR family transcriptional regulator
VPRRVEIREQKWMAVLTLIHRGKADRLRDISLMLRVAVNSVDVITESLCDAGILEKIPITGEQTRIYFRVKEECKELAESCARLVEELDINDKRVSL